MAFVGPVSFPIKRHGNGFIALPPVIKIKDPLYDLCRLFNHYRPANDSGALMRFLSLYNLLSITEGGTKD